MDLLIEKGDSRTYLSRYKVITTSFEESSPSVKRNNTQVQYRNGNVDFGGWHEAKTIDYVGYYRADDIDEEEMLREKIYALLSDPDGYYVTQLKNDNDDSFERPGENTGDYFDKQVNRPSHKRFYVYASSLESELVGSYGGHVLYKISATFTTMKLPYGESVPRDLDIKPNVPYYGRNLLIGSTDNVVHYTSAPGFTVWQSYVTQFNIGDTLNVGADITSNSGDTVLKVFLSSSKGIQTGYLDYRVSQGQTAHAFVSKTIPTGTTSILVQIDNSSLNGPGQADVCTISHQFANTGSITTNWSPAPEDPGYNEWYTNTYYNTKNLVIPYAGTVPCNQLEQGFTIEFTAKESGSNLKLNVNETELTYNGQLHSDDVIKLSGYEYTKNDINIVKSTNKAYFKLLPDIANKISSSIAGKIRILNFQNLYA